jgi:YVTN family beta-propeller protein
MSLFSRSARAIALRLLVAIPRSHWTAASTFMTLASCDPGPDAAEELPAELLTAGELLSTTGWVTVNQPSDPILAQMTLPASAATGGAWSPVQSWPLNGLHMTVLPSGRVLSYGTALDGSTQDGHYFDVWDPAAGGGAASHKTTYDSTKPDSFCGASTYLPDGTLLVSSGNGGLASQIYDATTDRRTALGSQLSANRWYATMLTLPDGRPLVLGGMIPYTEGMQNDPAGAISQGLPSMTPEVWEGGTWRSLFGAYSRDAFGPDYLRCSYPRAFVAPDGRVFGLSSERMWYLDPANNGAIQTVGAFKVGYSATSPVNVGATNTAVMYTTGKILVVGGNGGFNGDGLPASNMATSIDINGGGAVLTELTPMTYPRRYPNAIVLADGKVVITGGTRKGNNNGTDAVYPAELWNPNTSAWTIGASAAIYRGYHSFSVLLPSGAILSAGGGAPGPVTNLNAELYYPPSLFRTVNGAAQLAPRPSIVGLSGVSFANGATFQLDLSSSAPVSQLVLLGVSNGTHSFNVGQRRVPLTFAQDSFRVTASVPSNLLAPPGYYQLVAVDANGVPSPGVIVAVGQGVAAPTVATTPYNPPVIGSTPDAPVLQPGGTAQYAVTASAGVTYSWDFGDGSATTPFSSTASASHTFASPGVYTVMLTAKAADGSQTRRTFLQAVATASTAQSPASSSALAFEPRTGNPNRLWVANPDSNTVAVLDLSTRARVAEIAVGAGPRSVARAPNGKLWVVNKDAATLSVVDPGTLTVTATVALPRGSAPHGLVFAPSGSAAYLALEGASAVARLDPSTGAVVSTLALAGGPRQLAISGDSATLLVSQFVSAPVAGESTATIDANNGGGSVYVVDAARMTLTSTVALRQSTKTDTPTQGAGLPNYLGAPVIAPDGTGAWVPSKQDNIKRGTLRNGLPLDFQNTVRAISSRVTLGTPAEDYARRIDHDNAGVASAAAFHPSGAYLFVSLETSRQVALIDANKGSELLRIDVGRAPQSLLVSPDGLTLYVQNYMDRSVSVLDLSSLVRGTLSVPVRAAVGSVGTETLAANVLLGKQLFYDARDTRLARDSYLSCASCHADGGHDGRVWDFTGFGEGLRNTISLRGHAGMGQGALHWSANFNELQDFEGQIRAFAAGTGLMTDAAFNTGTRSQPLGDAKTGVSADLDALAAYMTSLGSVPPSPVRPAAGQLSTAAAAGKVVFQREACASCHGGPAFTNSRLDGGTRNVGAIKATSGTRLKASLTGIDIPTLRDVWATAPYLHDGSAATLADAVRAHTKVALNATDLANVAAYLQHIDSDEAQQATPIVSGSVYRIVAAHSGQVLAINGANTASGTGALQWPWNYGNDQRWLITNLGNGSYSLRAQHSGLPLTVVGCSAADGGAVQQVTASTTACQAWRLDDQGDGTYRIANSNSGKVLDVAAVSTTAGAAVQQWTWWGGANQRWRLEQVGANNLAAATYRVSPTSNLNASLDVAAVSTASGAIVQQWTWWGGNNQRWTAIASQDGFIEFAPAHAPTMRLEVAGGSLAAGANVQQGTASGSAAQRWSVTASGGNYQLVNQNSGKVLDVLNCSAADGSKVQQWDSLGTACQFWKLTAQ